MKGRDEGGYRMAAGLMEFFTEGVVKFLGIAQEVWYWSSPNVPLDRLSHSQAHLDLVYRVQPITSDVISSYLVW